MDFGSSDGELNSSDVSVEQKQSLIRKLSQEPSAHVGDSSHKAVPQSAETLLDLYLAKFAYKYVAEGRANVVFSIIDTSTDSPLTGFLLRAPKIVEDTDPYGYPELQRFREEVVLPSIGDQFLIAQRLVRLPAYITEKLNLAVTQAPKAREPRSKVAEGYAMIIEDMRIAPNGDFIGFEFKPKWLAQSPLAPEDAVRCRTCAREASRNSQKLAKGHPITPPVCPLGLVDGDPDNVKRVVQLLSPGWSQENQERLATAFNSTELFKRLRARQLEGDPGDTMFKHPEDRDFGLAMTLRDCTCFVKMLKAPNSSGPEEVQLKLADVDRKNYQAKAEYWQDSHNHLVQGRFYHGAETPQMETHCLLAKAT